MEIKVLYFASAREEIGLREEKLQLPDKSSATLASLRHLLGDKYPHAASTIESIPLAHNLEYSEDDVALVDGDEVALILPFSDGCRLHPSKRKISRRKHARSDQELDNIYKSAQTLLRLA
ncbi:hypothetical protein KXD40_005081 [Peronospora effusa]|uniref:Molybdopterin synthase sulfur carrier subunit n=1 Tax=Peronospora effusa TaxID=542832 RepID=A0A3M6VN24_9STRA|nr:hypothetical protein DD238_002722 [Peronospora effusa]RQM16866.1 hypothetical protein DD237_003425 [Peronospora effusa]UIZ22639.1 hypothetical protein KXD40_005081 [Peronospora effusa]CAI5710363.1 unnamed protein product [Peronospora effusa]